MTSPLLDLLIALAELFEPGGRFRTAAFGEALRGGWAGPPLRGALEALLAADPLEREVAYADHFLFSSWHPVLHLEASVQTLGHLCDEELLARREALHRQMGVRPPEGRCADHLASGFTVLATALGVLAENPADGDRNQALRTFVNEHLAPQVRQLKALGSGRPLHPVYAAALDVAMALLDELGPALAGPDEGHAARESA